MDSRRIVFQETAVIALGQLICFPVTVLAFYLAGYLDRTVILGCVSGIVIALANFFFMAVSASLAADKAQQQNVKGGQSTIQTSFLTRQVLMFLALALCAKSGKMNLIALVIPILLVRPIITISEFFRKKGGN